MGDQEKLKPCVYKPKPCVCGNEEWEMSKYRIAAVCSRCDSEPWPATISANRIAAESQDPESVLFKVREALAGLIRSQDEWVDDYEHIYDRAREALSLLTGKDGV